VDATLMDLSHTPCHHSHHAVEVSFLGQAALQEAKSFACHDYLLGAQDPHFNHPAPHHPFLSLATSHAALPPPPPLFAAHLQRKNRAIWAVSREGSRTSQANVSHHWKLKGREWGRVHNK